jgi:hypothetical protein
VNSSPSNYHKATVVNTEGEIEFVNALQFKESFPHHFDYSMAIAEDKSPVKTRGRLAFHSSG